MKRLGFFVGAVGVLAAEVPATATTIVGIHPYLGGDLGTTTDPTTLHREGSDIFSSYTATATVGALKVATTTALTSTIPPGGYGYQNASTSVSAFWGEYLTINVDPGVTSGVIHSHLLVEGGMTTMTSAGFSGHVGFSDASVGVSLSATGAYVLRATRSQSTYSGFSPPPSVTRDGMPSMGPFFTTYDFDIPFASLDPVGILVAVSCGTSGIVVASNQSSGGTCDLGHSIYWGGVSGVADQDGRAVNQFSIVGESGFNYNNASPLAGAVPEPATWALLVGGFGLVGVAVRRRSALAA